MNDILINRIRIIIHNFIFYYIKNKIWQ